MGVKWKVKSVSNAQSSLESLFEIAKTSAKSSPSALDVGVLDEF